MKGSGYQTDSPPEKATFKKPSFIRFNDSGNIDIPAFLPSQSSFGGRDIIFIRC